MITKYTEEEFENAKSTDLLPLECEQCGKIFFKEKKEIAYQLAHTERRRCRFCSTECLNTYNKKGVMYIEKCANCGKEIIVKDSDYKRSKTKRFFCSCSCSATFNNKLRGKKYITSKNSLVNKKEKDEFIKIIKSEDEWVKIGKKLGYKSQLSNNVKKNN